MFLGKFLLINLKKCKRPQKPKNKGGGGVAVGEEDGVAEEEDGVAEEEPGVAEEEPGVSEEEPGDAAPGLDKKIS